MLATSKVTISSGRRRVGAGGLSRSWPGRKRRIRGTSNGWSPNEAMTRWAAGRARSACASASMEPSASPSGRTWQARQTSSAGLGRASGPACSRGQVSHGRQSIPRRGQRRRSVPPRRSSHPASSPRSSSSVVCGGARRARGTGPGHRRARAPSRTAGQPRRPPRGPRPPGPRCAGRSPAAVSGTNVRDGVCRSPVCRPTSDRITPVALASAAAVAARSSSEPYTV